MGSSNDGQIRHRTHLSIGLMKMIPFQQIYEEISKNSIRQSGSIKSRIVRVSTSPAGRCRVMMAIEGRVE